jgi:hypothetical protein
MLLAMAAPVDAAKVAALRPSSALVQLVATAGDSTELNAILLLADLVVWLPADSEAVAGLAAAGAAPALLQLLRKPAFQDKAARALQRLVLDQGTAR